MPSPFVHLRNHSEFSLLDGAARVKDIVKYAVEMEMPAVTVTEQNYREEGRWRYDCDTGQVIANRCPRCQQWRPLDEYNKGSRTKHGTATYCKSCSVQWASEWGKSERGRRSRHRSRVLYEYNLSAAEFEALKSAQNDQCKICQQEPDNGKELCVDHCHGTGRVRGLLCDRCNRAIGYLKESPALLRAAADYIEQQGGQK